jgi:hypothetical protein
VHYFCKQAHHTGVCSYFYVCNVKTFLVPFRRIVLLLEQEVNAARHRLHVNIIVRYEDALSETKALVKS